MKDVSFYNYGDYSSGNYGAHLLCFETPTGKFWFSYNTMVAFRINGEFHIVKNYWGTTTGKHLHWICSDKSIREDEETFESNYERCMRSVMREAV